MRNFILNLKIGTKLAAVVIVSLLAVGVIVFNQVSSSRIVRSTYDDAMRQKAVLEKSSEIKTVTRGMKIAVRDIRLAPSIEALAAASADLKQQYDLATKLNSQMLQIVRLPESVARLQRQKDLVERYYAAAKGFDKLRAEALKLGPDQTARYNQLMQQIAETNAAEAAPLADQNEAIATELVEVGQKVSQESVDKANAQSERAEWNAFVFAGIATLLLIASLVFCIAVIARPLRQLNLAMLKLAEGDFGVVLPGLGRKDEVGDIAGAVERFKVKAAEKAQLEAEERAAQDRRLAEQRRADMHKMASSFEAAVGEIINTVSSASTELEAAAGTLTRTASDTQSMTGIVAQASEESSSNVSSVASATEEMASSVGEIGRQVQESARIAKSAVEQARVTDRRINSLSESATRIGDVVSLITTIASQTNLLALNATIEAARAGDAGKGFAVVAAEVKALADQTARATSEIGQQVHGIQTATQESVGAIKEIGTTIERISEIAAAIASAVEQQGAATQEIARSVQQASAGTAQVASNIVEVQRGASETGTASTQVLSSAQGLAQDSNRLKIEVDKFLNTVRAA